MHSIAGAGAGAATPILLVENLVVKIDSAFALFVVRFVVRFIVRFVVRFVVSYGGATPILNASRDGRSFAQRR